jgi:hypothetical protein
LYSFIQAAFRVLPYLEYYNFQAIIGLLDLTAV